MKSLLFIVLCAFLSTTPVYGQIKVTANPNHDYLLSSSDIQLSANKKLVYDFWREVFEAGHMEFAEKYLTENYIQHNPNVGTGRAAFVELFGRITKPKMIEARIQAPLVSIIAEKDLVMLVFVQSAIDPQDKTKTYTTTWFDLFRIENGKIAEHWDADTKR